MTRALATPRPTFARRLSLWLMTAAMVLIIGLKSHGGPLPGVPWHYLGWPLVGASLALAWWRDGRGRGHGRLDEDAGRAVGTGTDMAGTDTVAPPDAESWAKTTVLLTWLIGVLYFTRIDGDTSDAHVLELILTLGVGILLLSALAARYWLKDKLDYSWVRGRWSLKMWLWFPLGFLLAYTFLYFYFHHWTPTLHHSWPLPLEGPRGGALWRLFWGCNFVGVWDELAFINFVFVLLARHFRFGEANLAQAFFFTSFLHEMAFVGWGPAVIFSFALVQGLTPDDRFHSFLHDRQPLVSRLRLASLGSLIWNAPA
ncbi:hypothetical protein CSA17_05255 [bacterium DOLJORAL78_65_58]|nr:MAG: hypothetical protein CSA17_05255 [bacterium DOLJORAL78_65_58]